MTLFFIRQYANAPARSMNSEAKASCVLSAVYDYYVGNTQPDFDLQTAVIVAQGHGGNWSEILIVLTDHDKRKGSIGFSERLHRDNLCLRSICTLTFEV